MHNGYLLLGHGPFSHLYDKAIEDRKFTNEKMKEVLFLYISFSACFMCDCFLSMSTDLWKCLTT